MKRHLRLLLVLFLCSTLFLPYTVLAASSIKLTKKTYINTGSGSNIVAKFKTDKGYAYCITPGKTGPAVGTTLTLKNTIKSGGLVYLLDNAGTSDSSFLATQLAVWKYSNNFTKPASSSNWSRANSLVSKAKSHSNYTTTPSIKLTISSSKMVEYDDYYKSGKITLTGKNLKGAITIAQPKVGGIVDANGKAKTSFKVGDSFYYKVSKSLAPATETTLKITASSYGYETYVNRYKSSNSKYQELVIPVKEKKKVSSSVSFKLTPVIRKCQYYKGKYYDKNGKLTDKTTYSIQCLKHTCEKVGDTYFGKSGKIVDKITFTKECEKHVCEKIGDTYFGSDGKEVDQRTYSKQCEKHYCEIIDGTYFGKNGYEVDETTYSIQCLKHTCEKVGDTYFGKSGKVVSYETFTLECEKHVCEKVGDTYFGRTGNKVSYETYTLECEKHACEKIGNTFIGSNGQIVDEATYNQQCLPPVTPPAPPEQIVDVPDTADVSGLIFTLIGTLLIGGTVVGLNTISKRA